MTDRPATSRTAGQAIVEGCAAPAPPEPATPPMSIIDIHVGMRLRSICRGHHNQIVVTSLTERGFRYKVADDEEVINPHWSMRMERDGHECFALNGLCWWEPVLQ